MKKHLKRRWTNIENKQLYDAFGKEITAKKCHVEKELQNWQQKWARDLLHKLEHKCTITYLANCPAQLSTNIFSKVKAITVILTTVAYHLCDNFWINGSISKS